MQDAKTLAGEAPEVFQRVERGEVGLSEAIREHRGEVKKQQTLRCSLRSVNASKRRRGWCINITDLNGTPPTSAERSEALLRLQERAASEE